MYKILELNPALQWHAGDIDLRMRLYQQTKDRLLTDSKTLNDFANGHEYYGFHRVPGGWVYREWAPSAKQLYLSGDFNNWDKTSHPLESLGNGSWELRLSGEDALWEGCKVKTVVDAANGRTRAILASKHAVGGERGRAEHHVAGENAAQRHDVGI